LSPVRRAKVLADGLRQLIEAFITQLAMAEHSDELLLLKRRAAWARAYMDMDVRVSLRATE
jgi:hypothetical protein